MKKTFLVIALIASMCVTTSNAAETVPFASNDVVAVSSTVDGTYAGKAYATKMNGNSVSNLLSGPYSTTFTITDGVLEGSFYVGPHKVYITSDDITGAGTYKASGSIKMIITQKTSEFSGTLTVTQVDGTDLVFTCSVATESGSTSEFSFTTK